MTTIEVPLWALAMTAILLVLLVALYFWVTDLYVKEYARRVKLEEELEGRSVVTKRARHR